jgi:hypothetical protein
MAVFLSALAIFILLSAASEFHFRLSKWVEQSTDLVSL